MVKDQGRKVMDQTAQQVAGPPDSADPLVGLKEYFHGPVGAMIVAEHIANATPIPSAKVSRDTGIAIEDVDRMIDEIGRNELMRYVAIYCIDLRRFIKEDVALVDEVLDRMIILFREGSSTTMAQFRAIFEFVSRKLRIVGRVAINRARQLRFDDVGTFLLSMVYFWVLALVILLRFDPYKYFRADRTVDMGNSSLAEASLLQAE
ncbi:hypothetical protein H2202_002967 [Exophiala xenobiotica]|nr:hypothetical protein H2202_002967 [Exophiala xenobiotica]KAK5199978.1 hypothetical protein LTR92_000519 [Exophiala xenobiotica]KAK5247856.1 hypothetical protein LTS06_007064 [Exophiala xenobiotica]KAK5259103.1 hypothetical protein LTR40_006613 [Exophiala xenobiotica]KAK5354523.1 hypothetical protein LTR61_001823 [Exophiala xenobiotica]